jgi:hypothetical protein
VSLDSERQECHASIIASRFTPAASCVRELSREVR